MADLSTELRRAVDEGVRPITADEARTRAAARKPAPRRTLALVVGASLVVAIVGLAVLVDRGASPAQPRVVASAGEEYRSASAGFAIRIPAGWYRARQPLAPWLVSPHELASVATSPVAPIDASGNQAACPSEIPRAGVDAVMRDGVFVWLGEANHAFSAAPEPRPEHFAAAAWHPLCSLGDGLRTQGTVFEDSGRLFVVSVVVGPDTPQSKLDDLYRMLDSLSVDASK